MIYPRKMCHVHNENWQNRRIRIAKSTKNQNIQRKGKLQVLGNTGSGHLQTRGDEEKKRKKKKKRISQTNEKTARIQTLRLKSHEKDKHLDYPP